MGLLQPNKIVPVKNFADNNNSGQSFGYSFSSCKTDISISTFIDHKTIAALTCEASCTKQLLYLVRLLGLHRQSMAHNDRHQLRTILHHKNNVKTHQTDHPTPQILMLKLTKQTILHHKFTKMKTMEYPQNEEELKLFLH
jgi:hypothetical protein